MIISDLPYIANIHNSNHIQGGARNNNYDNRAGALAFTYVDSGSYENFEIRAATLTSVYIEPRISQARSSSEAGFRAILS